MSALVNSICKLARRADATFLLRVSGTGTCTVSFKVRGRKAFKICDPLADDIDPALRALLKRIEFGTNLVIDRDPQRDFVENLTSQQRLRLGAILKTLRDFKAEVISGAGPADSEPALASPRSSLNPKFLDGEPESPRGENGRFQ